MANLQLRYDLRNPDFSTSTSATMYAEAIEQCAWGEKVGFCNILLSEHHGAADGYCPSPLLLASAISARTDTVTILIGALVAPLHEPARLAEDLSVLDIISKGRVIPVLGAGYLESEYLAIGKTLSSRKRYMDDIIPFLEKAWTGEHFVHNGRPITITPRPYSQPRPVLFLGGSSKPAAIRAAHHADFFYAAGVEAFEYYRQELQRLGKPDPGPMSPDPGTITFVSHDPDEYWEKIAPFVLHETNSYREWANETAVISPYKSYANTDELRESGFYQVYTPQELIDKAYSMQPDQPLQFHPMCGGIEPALAWQSLRCFADHALPVFKEEGLITNPFSGYNVNQ